MVILGGFLTLCIMAIRIQLCSSGFFFLNKPLEKTTFNGARRNKKSAPFLERTPQNKTKNQLYLITAMESKS
jgi:hypothetical protein